MNEETNHIDILIGKSISGNATAEEMQQLEKWKTSADENRLLFEKSKKAWEKGDNFISETTLQRDKSKLETELNHYLAGKVRKINRQSFFYKIAAILAFPIALAVGWYLFGKNAASPDFTEQYSEIISPKGHISKVILPDGTKVWINSGSSVTYNAASFNNSREIQLKGEAYFEVTSGEERPFKVATPHADVNVTGTAFNVIAYPDDDTFETVLAEGSVQLQLKTGNPNFLELNPNERVLFDIQNGILNVREVDAKMFTSWHNGELLFKDAALNDLIKELERIYDISFHMQPANLGKLRFRGMFSYNNNLIEALEKIKESSGIDYYIENKEVWLKKGRSK